jgi:hypothetical protein
MNTRTLVAVSDKGAFDCDEKAGSRANVDVDNVR